jgi:hypothetical protein
MMETKAGLKRRVSIEGGMAALTAFLTVLTLVSREWIEFLTGWDPDRGNGSLEWLIVVVLAAATVALALRARVDWRRYQALPA